LIFSGPRQGYIDGFIVTVAFRNQAQHAEDNHRAGVFLPQDTAGYVQQQLSGGNRGKPDTAAIRIDPIFM